MRHRKMQAGLQISTIKPLEKAPRTYKHYLKHLPFAFRLLTIVALVIVLARPQRTNVLHNENIEGIDIVIALDISTSMLAEDLSPNRIDASKDVAAEFIMGRPNDNIGLVIFASQSFTQCPLTSDHTALVNLLQAVECGMIEDGTAIGLGLTTAVNRLKDSQAKSKVVILLTDGSNNVGEIAPITAADIARTLGIRVYTIGIGTNGEAMYPFQTAFGIRREKVKVEIDENTLKRIALITGGAYFRATDNKKLVAIYEEIDQMEKTIINVENYKKKHEEYLPFAFLALAFLLMEILLRRVVLRSIP
jgi:Ca-activated chloride channel family protein